MEDKNNQPASPQENPTPSPKTLEYIAKQDAALNKKLGWTRDSLTELMQTLTKTGRVEVGWRESCGTTDATMHTYRAWVKLIPKLHKDGLVLTEERVKHKNAYATNNGGFWNSIIYRLEGAVAA